jgi:hypothetical protein
MRKRTTSEETLEQKITKAQEKVARTAAAHEKAVDELQILLDKRDAKRKDEIWEAIVGSSRSYEEILGMIRGEMTDTD